MDVGAKAVFRCQHPTADIIRWRVNRSLISQRNSSAGLVTGRDDNGNTLTVTARQQYNGSEVVCVAQFDDGSPDEVSGVAILQGIKGYIMQATVHRCSAMTTENVYIATCVVSYVAYTCFVFNACIILVCFEVRTPTCSSDGKCGHYGNLLQ